MFDGVADQRGAQDTGERRQPAGLWLALAMLFVAAFLRCPSLLIHGRVWAEESSVFLVGAWNHGMLSTLLAPEFGYYSVWDNFFAAVGARWVPLSWVALLFSWSAMGLLLVTGYFSYEAEFLTTRTAKTLGVLALVLTPANVESWMNVINSEFYFGILSAVILFSDPRRLRVQRGVALGVAALSGPLTTFLAPLFVVRAVLRRRRGEIVQAAIVCAGALTQLVVAMTTSTSNRKVQFHPLPVGPVLLNKEVVLLFLDRAVASRAHLLMQNRLHFSTATQVGAWFLVLLSAGALAYALRCHRAALMVFLTALWFAVVEALLALNGGLSHVGPGAGERYSFTPNYLILLSLVAAACATGVHAGRMGLRVLLALGLISGALDYGFLTLRTETNYHGESWREQALHWQADPTTPLHALPSTWPAFHLAARQ